MSIRDLWRTTRATISGHIAGYDPGERATFLIVAALALALAFAIHGISSRAIEPDAMLGPSITAPPFELRFAATVAGQHS